MKKILLIATGGTICSVETQEGLAPGITAEELLSMIPRIRKICSVEVVQPYSIDSTNVTPGHWQMLTETVEAHYGEFDGFVIAHGTDTLAYTAAALTYMIQGPRKPVVLTGSQLSVREEGTDAIRNLSDAFLYAADGDSSGVCVVFGGRVIDGACARKMYSRQFDAFASINRPEIARIKDGKICREGTALPGAGEKAAKEPPVFFYGMDPDVCVLKLTPGLSAAVFRQVMEEVRGVVLEGYGTGGIPEYLRETFYETMETRKEKGYLTMMATQAFYQGTDMEVYEVGWEAKRRTGILECREMTVEAASAYLMRLLGEKKK